MRIAGLTLLLLGAFALLFGSVRYTMNESMQGLSPLVGALIFTIGAALLYFNRRGPPAFR